MLSKYYQIESPSYFILVSSHTVKMCDEPLANYLPNLSILKLLGTLYYLYNFELIKYAVIFLKDVTIKLF